MTATRCTYTTTEAATILGASRQTIARMIAAGKLPTVDTGTTTTVIPAWAVDELVARPDSVTAPRSVIVGLLEAAAAGAPVDSLVGALDRVAS